MSEKKPLCYTCKSRPAGHPRIPLSAYCEECQPYPDDPKLTNSQNLCRGCGEVFASLKDFDRHRTGDWPSRLCLDPVMLGLELYNGTWGTPEGNRFRADFARKAQEARAARISY